MITRVVYNNKAFKIIDEYSIKFSNNEVTFNDIKIDFTNRSIADIPYKYQEIKIMQAESEENILNGKILFTGFLDEIEISEMKRKKEFIHDLFFSIPCDCCFPSNKCLNFCQWFSGNLASLLFSLFFNFL